jgi:hypothetical protein
LARDHPRSNGETMARTMVMVAGPEGDRRRNGDDRGGDELR